MQERKLALRAYLLWAFGIAWVLQITAGMLYRSGHLLAYSPLLALSMFSPMLAVLLAKGKLKGMGWKPRLKGNIRWILAAWFVPAVLGTLGAALYFLLVPEALDLQFTALYAALGETGEAQMEQSGLSVPLYVGINALAALSYAPWLNMLFAVGEEAGWRGAMYPLLKERFGRAGGRVIGGMIWGVWHWPIMLLAGYEYGFHYWGAPVTGPLLFCLIATVMGICLDFLYEKTGSVWVPALCHGAINAFAGVPTLVLNPAYSNQLLLGPLMVGLVGGLPMILLGSWLCSRGSTPAVKEEDGK